MRTSPDTPVPRDAPCAQCGAKRPPLARRDGDPYCSRACAEQAHGVAPRREPPERLAMDMLASIGRRAVP